MENLQNELGGRVTRQCDVSQTASDASVSKGERVLREKRMVSYSVEYLFVIGHTLGFWCFLFIVEYLINRQ